MAAPVNSKPTKPAALAAATQDLEAVVRARIESLAFLPTTAAVAMKFVELGKNPEASPDEYTKVISSDSSLSTKLLALANSSWFGVRNRVTKVQVAVNLLGLATVRTMAISYCLTGLHNELRLAPDESKLFWAASLCKAVAARQFAARRDKTLAEEAFAAGLFQDFALPIMFAAARDAVTPLLHDPSINCTTRLQRERALFRLDHAELARSVALKLELPELFVDAVAFHHSDASLREFVENGILADAVKAAALFPHVLESWNKDDADELKQLLAAQNPPIDPTEFLTGVQKEFDQLYAYFEQGAPPEARLTEILESASREAAESTTRLVGTVHDLLQQAASAGKEVHNLLKQNDQLEAAAQHDGLTGALNRDGFTAKATEMVANAERYGIAYALVFCDVDEFKQINDTLGHDAGDAALKRAVDLLRAHVRQTDLVCRLGGDEFVVLLHDYAETAVAQTVGKILHALTQVNLAAKGAPVSLGMSVGIAYVPAKTAGVTLDALIAAADGCMYQSKRGGGKRAHATRLRPKKAA